MGLLIPCSKELVGSNPTPRAYLRVLYKNNKSKGAKKFTRGDSLLEKKSTIPLIIGNSSSNTEKLDNRSITNKIDSITNNCSKKYFKKALCTLAGKNPTNAAAICDYLLAEENENNIKQSTKEGKLKTLVWLSNHFKDRLTFRQMSKEDILKYLQKDKDDKSYRWIGTYNGRQMILLKFFKWLHSSNESDSRLRKTPACMFGIKQLPKKDIINYKPTDMWYSKEVNIFLKYCPSKRDKAYHAMAFDTSCRPKELLDLKVSSIFFKKTGAGRQYAELVIKSGKSRTRIVPLIDSLPYVKDYLLSHKLGGNPDSWLFLSESNNTMGSKLTYDGLSYKYKYFYKPKLFPRLLNEQAVPEEDKAVIRSMLSKPWNLYAFRHSSLTEKSTYLKEPVLTLLAGWTMSSKMPQVYIHYLGNESVNSLLEAKGIIKAPDFSMNSQIKYCNNCSEPASPVQKFCNKCKMVLSYDAYNETLEEQNKKKDEIQALKESLNKEMVRLKEQITKEVKKEVKQLLISIKPEIIKEVIS